MKKSKSITLVIAPLVSTMLFNGCCGLAGGGSQNTTRDVYQNRDDCQRDWGEADLCQEMSDDDSGDYRRSGGVIIAGGRPIWGPQYYPGSRSVSYKGRTIAPVGKSTSMTPYVVTSRSSSSARGGVSSPTSRGGFGGSSSSSSS